MEDHEKELKDMETPELVEHLYGGLFSLFADDEEYADLLQLSAALGLKRFAEERLAGLPQEELLGMFEHGEDLVDEFIAFAADEGLVEEDEEDEED